ncbi:MAG: RluA family pseudouridine synthase [Candidatus Limiplasma sp.]|nr:RluA family pseudouridine synthase [Candidatus Limiplasma sp.]
MCKVVYEDNHLLVVVKPPNLLTQGDATGDDCLLERMKRYIGEKYHKPGAVYLGLVHRLDRPVGGLVALARTSKAAARLSEQLRSHAMEREYLAVVHGSGVSQEGVLENLLVKDEATGSVRVAEEGPLQSKAQNQPLPQRAALRFATLAREEASDTALLHVRLQTGRKHQIRVQLAHIGHPILQDMRYGRDSAGEPIALWGAVLRLTHPTTQESMVFFSPPQGKAFDRFSEPLADFFAAREHNPPKE